VEAQSSLPPRVVSRRYYRKGDPGTLPAGGFRAPGRVAGRIRKTREEGRGINAIVEACGGADEAYRLKMLEHLVEVMKEIGGIRLPESVMRF